MPPLNRALALDKRQHGAECVAEQLHLDVARPRETTFEVYSRIAKRGARLGACGSNGAREIPGARHRAHPLASAAGHGFYEKRVTDAAGRRGHLRVGRAGGERRLRARHHRHTRGEGSRARGRLAAHRGDGLRRRPDEGQAGIADGCGERLVLGEETVAGMHGVGARARGCVEDAVDAEVAVARRAWTNGVRFVGIADVQRLTIALGEDGHRPQAHLAARARNPHADFATVRDENLLHNGMLPCFFGGLRSRLLSRFRSAAMSFLRVSRGRITSSTNPRLAAI